MKCGQSRYLVDNFSEKYLLLYFMDIVHVTWTLSIKYGQCKYFMDNVHETWTIVHGLTTSMDNCPRNVQDPSFFHMFNLIIGQRAH